jgi:hypothetical protein
MRQQPKIKLQEWAARRFEPPPCRRTLYRWVKNSLIEPQPTRIGREYWVERDAHCVDRNGNVTS